MRSPLPVVPFCAFRLFGFMLMEVLVALVIVAISLMAIITVTGGEVRRIAHIEKKIATHQVAMNAAALLKMGVILFDVNQRAAGDESMLGSMWHWTVERRGDDLVICVFNDISHDNLKDRLKNRFVEKIPGFFYEK